MSAVAIKGAIDKLDGEGVIGWLYGADYDRPPLVRAFLQHDLIGEAVADFHRPDLEQVGFGDGRCGFDIRFHRPIDPSYLPFVTVRPENVDLLLPLPQTTSGYLDLVRNLFGAHAGAGRTRSVLGGLWTDRLDAPQVLAGRIAVGACPAELQGALQELILNGYVVLHNALAPNGVGARELSSLDIAAAGTGRGEDDGRLKGAIGVLGGLLFRDNVVRVLRAMFDDHPVIYKLDRIAGDTEFAQASTFDDLPSPAECAALYAGNDTTPVRLDILRNSHELPEFSPIGRSRWTQEGADDLRNFAQEAGLSIDSVELDHLDIAIVGPGLLHRVAASAEGPALRAVAAPRRLTPLRFLSGDAGWTEAGHVSGARIRV
ncbi:hypothetical protein [Rhizosaccharibacter radicis]|uniref:YcaO domain-containing protein n=1 Tax=Rhizosaccharibacter radicis TaxID=2782605 RepID=A0ABT1VT59_9PROT|nr:hypothetical protein [Acetobacteraceae bacterium KSS12]